MFRHREAGRVHPSSITCPLLIEADFDCHAVRFLHCSGTHLAKHLPYFSCLTAAKRHSLSAAEFGRRKELQYKESPHADR